MINKMILLFPRNHSPCPLCRTNVFDLDTTNLMDRLQGSLKLYMNNVVFTHSVVSDFGTPWTVTHEAPLSMEFSRQEYWNGLPFSSPRDLPNPGIEPKSLAW